MKLVNGIEVIDIPLNAPVIRDVRIGYLRKSFEPGRFSYLQGVGSGLINDLKITKRPRLRGYIWSRPRGIRRS